ncbi:MAG: NUDIX hydrolase [Ferrimicrobium sp.]
MLSQAKFRQRVPPGARRYSLHGPPRWQAMPSSMEVIEERLARWLSPISSSVPREAGAAVLSLLLPGSDGAEIVLTRRSEALRHHTGEISFPGGRLEPNESIIAAALRETEEEIGVPPDSVRVLGIGPTGFTRSRLIRFGVVVGVGSPNISFAPNEAEVAKVLRVSLARLVCPGVFASELWYLRSLGWREVHFFDLGDDLCWGATARVLVQLLDVVAD